MSANQTSAGSASEQLSLDTREAGNRLAPLSMAARKPPRAVLMVLLTSVVAGCGDDGGQRRASGQGGGKALGGDAKVRTLARAPLGSAPPANAGWRAWRVTLQPGEKVEHEHPFSTVYAEDGAHVLTVGGRSDRVEPRGGAVVQAGRRHVHEATEGSSVFWDVLLAAPGADLSGVVKAEPVFETEPLQGITRRAEVAFLDVALPARGGRTTVHTHPGPETIYVTSGPFEYQNAIEGSTTLDDGDQRSIPPGTAVQKRNPGSRGSRFLSWFVVDPAEEFAPAGEFPAK